MIARDEQNNLPRCLASVRGLFDEIVVLDTGSKDRTIEIARSFGLGCLISCGSMILGPLGMRRSHGPRGITHSGWMRTI